MISPFRVLVAVVIAVLCFCWGLLRVQLRGRPGPMRTLTTGTSMQIDSRTSIPQTTETSTSGPRGDDGCGTTLDPVALNDIFESRSSVCNCSMWTLIYREDIPMPSLCKATDLPLSDVVVRGDFFLLYQQTGGWNNQRISLAEAIMIGRCMNRTVVVHESLHVETQKWSDVESYLDLSALRRLHPVVSLKSFLGQWNGTNQFPLLQMRNGAGTNFFHQHVPQLIGARRRTGTIINPIDCATFSAMLRPYKEDKVVALDSLFGDYDFSRDAAAFRFLHRLIHASVQTRLFIAARDFVRKEFGGSRFIGVHLRRKSGWNQHCSAFAKGNDWPHCVPQIGDLVRRIRDVMTFAKIDKVFLSTDAPEEVLLAQQLLPQVRAFRSKETFDGNMLGIIDQVICSLATIFVGNRWSTFSGFAMLTSRQSVFY